MENELENEMNIYKPKEINNYSSKKKEKLFIMTEPNFYEKKIISKTMKNINELSLKANKVKRYSTNIRNELIKKMEKKPKLNEKQIYTPLYIQIHKSLKDIENELKIAHKYVLSEKEVIKRIKIPLYNSLFKLRQKNHLLLNNEEKSNNNYYFKTGKSKTFINKKKIRLNNIFIKTFSGNILNNRAHYRNKDKNILISNYSSPKSIDSYKNKFNFYQKKDTDIVNDSNNKSNILSPTNSNSPFITKKSFIFPKVDSKDIINKNLNISTINRTLTNSNIIIKTNNEETNKNQSKVRYKTFYIESEPNWYFKNKFIKNRIDKNMITNQLFQKKIIDDELALLFENMKIFQSKYLIDKSLSKYFNKISWYTQKSLNCNLEEAVGLLTEISYLLLSGYENIIKNFISNPIPRITKKKIKNVLDEKKEFPINISTFSETFIFLQVCYDAYNIISSKEEFYINPNSFELLNQYLDRARFVVSKICLDLNNMYKEQNKEDKKIIENCLKKIKNVNRKALINNLKISNSNISNLNYINNKKNKKNKSKIDCHLKFGIFNSGIDSFRYKGPKKLKLSDEHLTYLRINKAFGANSYRELKSNKHFAKFNINSTLVNQLMKYATNEFKSKVISERIRQRFIIPEIS